LFPNRKSKLAETDPELIEVFDNFAFKERLLCVVTQLLPYVGYPRTLNAILCLNEVLAE
jgi:hypothetical protein